MDFGILFIIGTIFFAVLVGATFGFGLGIIAMPILAVLLDIKTATPFVGLIMLTFIITILFKQWRSIQFKSVWRLIIFSFLGIPFGLFLLKGSHDFFMKMLLALITIGFAFYNIITPHQITLKTEKFSYIFGICSGILGGAYNIHGIPIAMYGLMRQWTPDSFRVTLIGYFLPSTLLLVLGHYAAGLWTPYVIKLFILSLPAVFFGIFMGNRLNRSIPRRKYDRIIYILLIFFGLLLFFQVINSMLTGS
jgi:uncharacterized membrane protein YfcA